nr:hypothetical protein [Bacilli bacterium]
MVRILVVDDDPNTRSLLSHAKKILDLHQTKIEVQSEMQQSSLFTMIIDNKAT